MTGPGIRADGGLLTRRGIRAIFGRVIRHRNPAWFGGQTLAGSGLHPGAIVGPVAQAGRRVRPGAQGWPAGVLGLRSRSAHPSPRSVLELSSAGSWAMSILLSGDAPSAVVADESHCERSRPTSGYALARAAAFPVN